MDSVEKIMTMPDGSTVRYYVDIHFGIQTLNMDDVVRVLKSTPENIEFLKSKMGDFVAHYHGPLPPTKPIPPEKPERELSDFNQKLLKGLNWNPKDHKKK